MTLALTPEAFSLLSNMAKFGIQLPNRWDPLTPHFQDLLKRGFIERRQYSTDPVSFQFVPSADGINVLLYRANHAERAAINRGDTKRTKKD